MFSYILQVTLCWSAFYLLYLGLLRKETFFHINRWYLLGTLAIGLLIPFIEWQPSPVIEHHPTYEIAIEPIQFQMGQLEQSIEAASQSSILDWTDICLAIYLSGVLFFMALLLHGLWKIWKLYRKGEVETQGNIRVVYTPESHLPFSFFNYLFWSKHFESEHQEKAQILRHEEAHIYQWHTLDVLFLELLNILFWCSPIIYFYRKSLRTTHEYLADALVLKDTKRKEYGHLLLKQSLSGIQIALANHFIHSQLKNRILMMTRNQSRKRNLMKYLPLLPILLLAILIFSKHDGRVEIEKAVSSLTETGKEIISKENDTKFYDEIDVNDGKIESSFIHPVKDQNKITREMGYGMRMHPIFKKRQMHTGVDYVVPMNTEIVATADGKIVTAKNLSKGFGVHITIEHTNGYSTFYAHLEKLLVKEGQQVKQGEVIALSGNTGISTGPHLHYEVRKNGEAIDFEKEDLGMNISNNTNTLAQFASNYSTYDQKAIESSFEAVFHNPNLTLEDRNKMLSEDYRLFIARHKERKEDIENMLKRVVFMRGFSMEILDNEGVYLYKKNEGIANTDVDEMPRFPSEKCEALESTEAKRNCSNQELIKYIYTNIKYPAAAKKARIEGMNLLRFKVMQDGSLDDIRLLKDIGHGCGEEAKRVIEKMNSDNIRWIPGKKDGKNVAIEFTIPVKFELTDDAPKSEEEEVFKVVEQMPQFPSEECVELKTDEEKKKCSDGALTKYLFDNLKYPKAAKEAGAEGMCVVQFTIEKDGSVSDVAVVRDVGAGLGDESARVVHKMNEDSIHWIPGVQRGRKVRVRFTLPVKFDLGDYKTTPEKFDPTPKLASQKLQLTNFNIAPNPSNGELRLRFASTAKPIAIKVYDGNGKMLFEEQVHNFDGNYNQQIEVNGSAGIHFLTIEQEGKIFVEQMMIE